MTNIDNEKTIENKVDIDALAVGLYTCSGPTRRLGMDPSPYQYSMAMVALIRIDGVPNHQMNNHLAVFSKGQIRAYGTAVAISGQAYYFLNIYSNIYEGDTLYFRAYIGADNKIYESADTAVFRHHLALGNLSTPFQIRLNLGDRPLIYTLSEINYQANSCPEVLDIQASDKQNSEGNGLTYSITGGADAARFGINPQTGLLSWFNFTPDFITPQDANGDNRYEVDVKVSDASNLTDVQHITVTVVNAVPLPPLVCPANIALLSSSDGLGNCGASSNQTAISLSNPCVASLLSYEMSGATSAGGTGLVPPALVFAVGLTTVYYFQAGYECPFTVTVTDDEPPEINCPASHTVSPTIVAPCSAVVSDSSGGCWLVGRSALGVVPAGSGRNCPFRAPVPAQSHVPRSCRVAALPVRYNSGPGRASSNTGLRRAMPLPGMATAFSLLHR